MKLKTRALLAFVCIALLASMVTGFFLTSKSLQSLRNQAVSFLISVNMQKKARIEQWLANASTHMEVLANMPLFTHNFPPHLQHLKLQQLQDHQAFFATITQKHLQPMLKSGLFTELFLLHIPEGEVLTSTDSHQIGKVMKNRDFFQKGARDTFIGNVYYSMTLMQPSLMISTPLRMKEGKPYAVLVGRLNLSTLSTIMEEQTSFWQSEDSYLVNMQNFFITEPRFGNHYMLRKTVHTQGVALALSGQTGSAQYEDYRTIPVIGAYMYVQERELGLITEIDQEEFFIPIRHLQRKLAIIGGVIICLTILLGWLFAETLLRPLAALTNAVKGISGENLTFAIKPSGPYEIQAITRAFIDVIEQLNSSLVSRKKLQQEIEQRKQTEEKLHKTLHELKQSNIELEQFAYVASHDLQEPLRMISSYNQLLAQKYRGKLDKKADTYIRFSVDGAQRMQQLIQDLLAYSRVTTKGKEFVPVDANLLLQDAKHNLSFAMKEHQVKITADSLPWVMGDATQITQLLQNLLSNAIKFRKETAPTIQICVQQQDDMWEFMVQDDGIGIEEKYADRIFVIFQRLHTREEYQGTGIGLAICKRIIERHGGKIWFTSVIGQGTSFHFTLPAASSEVPTPDQGT